jgi:predicted ester cyclase/ketosteroid isomerase-like protein
MRYKSLLTPIFFFSVCSGVSAQSTAVQSAPDIMDLQKARKTIENIDQQFSEEYLRGDSLALAAHYAKDGQLGSLKGKAILAYWGSSIRDAIRDSARNLIFRTTAFTGDGEYMIDLGVYEIKDDLNHLKDIGKYLVVWKQEKGEWKIYRDMGLASAISETLNKKTMSTAELNEFGKQYAEAWCSQKPDLVAAFFAESGSLRVNQNAPAVGRTAITRVAEGFMTAFPDMRVAMDSLIMVTDGITFHWTLTGTNTGPNGTGKKVRISGFELWQMSPDGLIQDSRGSFDTAEYERQLKQGAGN